MNRAAFKPYIGRELVVNRPPEVLAGTLQRAERGAIVLAEASSVDEKSGKHTTIDGTLLVEIDGISTVQIRSE